MLSFIGAALASDPSLFDLLVGPALIATVCVLVGSVGWRVLQKRRFISQRGQVLDDDPMASVPEAMEQVEAQPSLLGSLAPSDPSIPAQPRLPFGLSVPSSPLIAMRSEIPAEYMVNSMPVGAERLSGFATLAAPPELLPTSDSTAPLEHATTEIGPRADQAPVTQRGAGQADAVRAEAQANAERLAAERKAADEAAQRAQAEERRAEEEQSARARAAAEKAEAGRLAEARAAVERAENERIAAERALAEKIEAERAAAARVIAEQAAAARAAEQAAVEQAAAARAAELAAAERAEAARAAEQAASEADALAAEADEDERISGERESANAAPTSVPAPPLKSHPAAPLLSHTPTSPPAGVPDGACTVPPSVTVVPGVTAGSGHDDASALTPVYNTALPTAPARCRPPTIPPPNLNACTPGKTRAA
jgi:hypothetical protein